LWVHSDDGATYRGTALDLSTGGVPLWGAVSTVDGRLVAVYSYRTASVHELAGGQAIARTGPLPPLDGRAEVVVHPSKVVPSLRFTLEAGRIGSLAFQPGGTGLVAGTVDGAVRLLGLDFSRQRELQPHRYFPVVQTAPDGRALVAAKDGAIRVYPWPPARPVLLRPVPDGPVALSPTGWLLAAADSSAGGDRPTVVWDLTPLVLADAVRRPVSTVDSAVVRDACAAARTYHGEGIMTTVLDALLAVVEGAVGQTGGHG
jgi:WD40 repeat protein